MKMALENIHLASAGKLFSPGFFFFFLRDQNVASQNLLIHQGKIRGDTKCGWSIAFFFFFLINSFGPPALSPCQHLTKPNIQKRALPSTREGAILMSIVTPDIVHHTPIKMGFLETNKNSSLRQYPHANLHNCWDITN
jgi:hypothetical protein